MALRLQHLILIQTKHLIFLSVAINLIEIQKLQMPICYNFPLRTILLIQSYAYLHYIIYLWIVYPIENMLNYNNEMSISRFFEVIATK